MSEIEDSVMVNSVKFSQNSNRDRKEGLKEILKEVTNDYNERDLIKVLKQWLKTNPGLSDDSV